LVLFTRLYKSVGSTKHKKKRKEVFVSPEFSARFPQVTLMNTCIATCTEGHRKWLSRWETTSPTRSFPLFSLLFVKFRIL